MYNYNKGKQDKVWRKKFPTVLGVLLSLVQLICTTIIVGCEVGGIFVHFPRMNAFVGYWVFPFFICAWISLSGASCCCRTRCCGIATLVFQCLAIPFASCVIGFNSYFLQNPTLCFFSSCTSSYLSSYYFHYESIDTLYSIKVPLIWGQLAAGCVMLITNIIYIIMFIVINYQIHKVSSWYDNSSMPNNMTQPVYQYAPTNVNQNYGYSRNNYPAYQNSNMQSTYNSSMVPPNNNYLEWAKVKCSICKTVFEIPTQQHY
ncbi:unnamed protein product [Adineta steineri]|uniref:Uncharacterized protein n=1 Tax=Adineta steineri TaxID=433720 RepID=A0A814C995_9BILA|nr:unnamed protein product [Adineta steineri]CAF4111748.1 unnamed protein product [Adineta steineri]